MKYVLLMIFAFSILMVSIPSIFATEYFHGTSSFENAPSEISRHFPSSFEIKMKYTVGPWGLDELTPVIEINPKSASSDVSIDFEPVSVYKGTVARIPVTVTVDPAIEYDKIFLSVFFEGMGSQNVLFQSGWADSLVLPIGPQDVVSYRVDYQKIPWGELEMKNDAAIFTKNMVPLSIVKAGEQFFVVQKVDFRDDGFAANSTFSAVVGYAFAKGDKMIPFPKGENISDEEHQEFAENTRKLRNEFRQTSEFAKSFEFKVNYEKPFLVKSPFLLQEPGIFTHQFYKKLKNSPAVSNSNMGSTLVVEKYAKAMHEDGTCDNENHRILIKHDYSTVACVTGETAWKLIGRGWSNTR